MLAESQHELVRRRCEEVLRQNWREGTRAGDEQPYAFTCPSPGRYPWQWYWDSCFHAIAWRHFDPARSRRELESLLAAQRDDGFIGHTIFWQEPLRGGRRYIYNVISPPGPDDLEHPAAAAGLGVADRGGRPGRRAADRGASTTGWRRTATSTTTGCSGSSPPDESGLDASNQFDAIWGRRAHGLPGYLGLVHRNRRLGFDLRRIDAAGGPVCCEVVTNVLYNLARLALGRPSLTPALIERTYDEATGAVRAPRATGPATHTRRPPSPRWRRWRCPTSPRTSGDGWSRSTCWTRGASGAPVPPPSVSLQEPSFSVNDRGRLRQRRYWRGPTWVNTAWLCWLGLVRLGYDQAAAELAQRLGGAVAGAGLREYYDPLTGAGMGARDFGWSSLVLELLEPDLDAARSSYLASAPAG